MENELKVGDTVWIEGEIVHIDDTSNTLFRYHVLPTDRRRIEMSPMRLPASSLNAAWNAPAVEIDPISGRPITKKHTCHGNELMNVPTSVSPDGLGYCPACATSPTPDMAEVERLVDRLIVEAKAQGRYIYDASQMPNLENMHAARAALIKYITGKTAK